MGFFGKLAGKLHGGATVRVEAPPSAVAGQPIPITVSITADRALTINSVKVEVRAKPIEEGVAFQSGGVGVQEQQGMMQNIAQTESREVLIFSAGETKTMQLPLTVQAAAFSGLGMFGQMPQAAGALGAVLQTVATAASSFRNVNYRYEVYAKADVADHALDPSDTQAIQILPPTTGSNAPNPIVPTASVAPPTEPSNPVNL